MSNDSATTAGGDTLLHRFRYEAKSLLRDVRNSSSEALRRFSHVYRLTDVGGNYIPYLPPPITSRAVRRATALKLADAQSVIAHEQGYQNWMDLQQTLKESTTYARLYAVEESDYVEDYLTCWTATQDEFDAYCAKYPSTTDTRRLVSRSWIERLLSTGNIECDRLNLSYLNRETNSVLQGKTSSFYLPKEDLDSRAGFAIDRFQKCHNRAEWLQAFFDSLGTYEGRPRNDGVYSDVFDDLFYGFDEGPWGLKII